jgi:hypothetical protein
LTHSERLGVEWIFGEMVSGNAAYILIGSALMDEEATPPTSLPFPRPAFEAASEMPAFR